MARPEWYSWKPGGTVVSERMGKDGQPKTYSVNDLVARRSDLVRRGDMTVGEWLDEARRLWDRDHPPEWTEPQ